MKELQQLKDDSKKGIWKWQKLLPEVSNDFIRKISLNEGDTELRNLEIEGIKFSAKLENKNPTGSHKDRSVAYQLSAELDLMLKHPSSYPFGEDKKGSPLEGGAGGVQKTLNIVPFNPKLKLVARKLRQNMTAPEIKFWQKIRQRNLGYKFLRQKPILNFISDFFSPELGLVIEIDGDSHSLQKNYDEFREKMMNELGIETIRFWNNEVMENLDGVLEVLSEKIRERVLYLSLIKYPSSSPQGENKTHINPPMEEMKGSPSRGVRGVLSSNETQIFTISSSGNAASSFSSYLSKVSETKLLAFLPKNAPKQKIEEIEKNENSEVVLSDNPKKESLMLDKKGKARALRQSTSPYSTFGYWTIAFELFENNNFDSIFIPTSSGVTLVGVYEGLKRIEELNSKFKIPKLFAVQTSSVYPIAKEFEEIEKEDSHPAKAICDWIVHRKSKILEILQETGGEAISSNKLETEKYHEILTKKLNLDVSEESAILISALKKLQKKHGLNYPCLIFTGKNKV